jgi:hypothetical protein
MADDPKGAAKASTSSPIERVREAAKWLIGAFAAIAALLLAGTQVSSVGQLTWAEDSDRLILAGVGLALGLGAALAAILQNVRMLLPKAMTVDRLVSDRELAAYFNANPELLPGVASNVTQFVGDFRSRSAAYDTAVAVQEASPSEMNKKRLEEAKQRLAAAERDMRDVLALANWKATEGLFNSDIRWKMCLAAALAAIGIGLFAWAANPPEEEKADDESPVLGVAPIPARLTVAANGVAPLKQALGKDCKLVKVRVLVIGGSKESPEVVTTPRRRCKAVRLVVSPELATVVPVR